MSMGASTRIWRRVFFLAAALAAALLSMTLSYAVVRHMTREFRMVHHPSPAAIQKATLLRAHANELAALTEAYLAQISLDAQTVRPAARQWVQQEFQGRLQALRGRMDDETLVYLPPYRDMMAAMERCAAMAALPGNAELRRQAVAMARLAVDGVERYLRESRLDAHVTVPAQRVSGGRDLSPAKPAVRSGAA